MHTIDILTGPIHSGKTTHLISWIKYHSHCAGILSPIVEGKRQFYSIHRKEFHRFESDEMEKGEALLSIGKYSFYKSSFDWARLELEQAVKLKPHWLIIDEIGPIELQGEGLEPQVSHILKDYTRSRKNRLILVVRNQILENVLEHYNLTDTACIHDSFLDIV